MSSNGNYGQLNNNSPYAEQSQQPQPQQMQMQGGQQQVYQFQPSPTKPKEIPFYLDPRCIVVIFNVLGIFTIPLYYANNHGNTAVIFFEETAEWIVALLLIIYATCQVPQCYLGIASLFNASGYRNYITIYETALPTFIPSTPIFHQKVRTYAQLAASIPAGTLASTFFFGFFVSFLPSDMSSYHIFMLFYLFGCTCIQSLLSFYAFMLEQRSLAQYHQYYNSQVVQNGTYGGPIAIQGSYQAPNGYSQV